MEASAESSPGAVAIYVYLMEADPDEFYTHIIFESKEAYVANAQRPETDASYRELLEWLVEEPEWHDGEIIYSEVYS